MSAYNQPVPQMAPSLLPARQQEIEDQAKIANIILETGCSADEAEVRAGVRLLSRSADGHDPARLRGLPAIGRNVSGSTVHTDPRQGAATKGGSQRASSLSVLHATSSQVLTVAH